MRFRPVLRRIIRSVGRLSVSSRRCFFPGHLFDRRPNVVRTAHEDGLRSRRVRMDDVGNAIELDSGLFRR
jgi:hypothetical protein